MQHRLRHLVLVLAGATAAIAPSIAAQELHQASSNTVSFAVTYSAGGSNLISSNRFWLEGGGAEFATSTFHGIAVGVSVVGLHTADSGGGIPVNLVITTFGPRYSWSLRHHVVLFAQGLVGEANGFRGFYPALPSSSSSASSLAIQTGGGMDLGISQHLSLRILQADWLRTQLPNSSTNVQNNLRMAAGIVFHTKSRR